MCIRDGVCWVRPAIVIVGAVDLALKGHGRDQTLKGLPATATMAARPTEGVRVAPTLTIYGPSSAMVF